MKENYHKQEDINLRNYFAAKAMQSLLTDFRPVYEEQVMDKLTSISYLVADAMMKASLK